MKVVDMHCDTLYELEKNHLSLSENNLNIDIKKMEEGDYLLQNFAIFTELKETADPVHWRVRPPIAAEASRYSRHHEYQ